MNKETCVKEHDDEKAWDRRGFLQCMAWVGTGAMWTLAGDTDDTFSHTFDSPGTYKYFCSIHPKMTGQVVVA